MKGVNVSEDEYLLQKVVPRDTIKRIIDWKSLGITKAYIDKQSKRKHDWYTGKVDKEPEPNFNRDNQEEMDRFYVTEMCLPYNPAPDDRDVFVWYNDIRFLSGTAGYIRIRDGYVWGQMVVMRS